MGDCKAFLVNAFGIQNSAFEMKKIKLVGISFDFKYHKVVTQINGNDRLLIHYKRENGKWARSWKSLRLHIWF